MPPKSIPLKWAAIAFMVPCLLISVSIALSLSTKNAEDALSKQRAHQDNMMASCFESAETRILSITALMLSERLDSVSCSVNSKLDEVRFTLIALLRLSKYWDSAMNWSQYLQSIPYLASLHSTRDVVTAVGFVGDDGKMCMISDFAITQGASMEVPSAILVTNEEGNAFTNLGQLADSYWYNVSRIDCTQDEADVLVNGTGDRSILFNAFGKCGLPTNTLPITPKNLNNDQVVIPSLTPQWAKLSAFSLFSGPLLMGRLHNDEATAYVASDIEILTNTIKGLFASNSKTSSERLMVTTPSSLIAVSHGESWVYKTNLANGWLVEKVPLNPTDEAIDPTIRSVSLTLLREAQDAEQQQPEKYSGASQNPFKHAGTIQQERNLTVQTFLVNTGNEEKQLNVGVKELQDEYDINWWLVVSLDADWSLESTREFRKETVALVDVRNSEIEDELKEDRYLHIGIVAAISVIMVAISVVMSFQLSKSLHRLGTEMHQVANLQLDDVDDATQSSILTEVASMQHSFIIMTRSMREYRPYMPQSLHPFSKSKTDEEIVVHNEATSSCSSSSAGVEGRKRRGSVISTTTTTSSKKKVLAVHIQRRKGCAQVAIGCHDFSKFVHTHDPLVITEFHSAWLQICLAESGVYHGTVERFNGDRIFINFNGLKPCIGSSLKAAKYSMLVREKLTVLSDEYSTQCTLPALAIASGSCIVGNMGCTGMKAPIVMGKISVHTMAIIAVCISGKFDILVGTRCADEIKSQFHTSAVDYIRLPESPRPHIIYRMAKLLNTNTEWMYAMHDRDSPYDRAWGLLMQNAPISQVTDMLSALPQADPLAKIIAGRLRRYSEEVLLITGKPPTEYSNVFKDRTTVPLAVHEYIESRLAHVETPGTPPSRVPKSRPSPAPSNEYLDKIKT